MKSQKPAFKWNTEDNHSPVVAYLNTIGHLSKEVVRQFDHHTFSINLAKGKFLLKPGSIADHLYFIVKEWCRVVLKKKKK